MFYRESGQYKTTYAADQALDIPLYNLNTIYGVNKRVGNLPPTPDVRFRFLETTVE